MSDQHEPVLLKEVIRGLCLQKGDFVIDGTVGGGGHALGMLKKIGKQGRLLGIDLDGEALKIAQKRLAAYASRVSLYHGSYCDMKQIALSLDFPLPVQAVLLDLGVSSMQLDTEERGFSFKSKARLDMRFDQQSKGVSAYDIVNYWPEKKLVVLFRDYGEERLSKKIAQKIVWQRKKSPIVTAKELADWIEKWIPRKDWPERIHPATRVFLALRIGVNQELNQVRLGLRQGLEVLEKGGRFAVISFHSLEDRIVKQYFNRQSKDCVCDPLLPVCRCEHQPQIKILTRKPITPSSEEVAKNRRARSAKLRIVEKL